MKKKCAREGCNNLVKAAKNKHCSRACFNWDRTWTEEEDQILYEYANAKPAYAIHKQIQRINREQGKSERTLSAVKSRLWDLGFTTVCTLNYFSICKLAETLSINKIVIRGWIAKGLTFTRQGNSYAISLVQLSNFAKKHPEYFTGIATETIQWLFEDYPKALEVIRNTKKRTYNKPIQVKRLDTEQRFKSVREAANLTHIDSTTLLHAMQKQGKNFVACGIPFEVIG